METQFLFLTQYDGQTIIPVQSSVGEIKLPLVRMDTSQKCAKGVHLQGLADHLDARRLRRQAVHQPTGLAQPAVRVAGRDEGAACDAVPAVPGYWMQTQLSSGLSTETGALDE